MDLEQNGYRLVWNDEFDDDTLDETKWTLRADMSKMPDLSLAGTENPEVMSVSDGKLKLNSIESGLNENGDKLYTTTYSVTTFNKMRFQYGYLEISARVPFMQGAWPSFWLKTMEDDICPKNKADYMAETDIFEVFSSTEKAVPNIHKWYNDGSHTQAIWPSNPYITVKPYVFKDTTQLCDEYHTYGFEWTPEIMAMWVDGERYNVFDLSANWDERSDMSGFHDSVYILFNNHLFTKNSSFKPDGSEVDGRTKFPVCYWIDYIRLYQKPDVGAIYLP